MDRPKEEGQARVRSFTHKTGVQNKTYQMGVVFHLVQVESVRMDRRGRSNSICQDVCR